MPGKCLAGQGKGELQLKRLPSLLKFRLMLQLSDRLLF